MEEGTTFHARGPLLQADVTDKIIAAAIEVHRNLGPGLLESAYQACLAREPAARSVVFRRQVELPITYKGESVDAGFRIDLLVEDPVVVELKSVDIIHPVDEAQLMTYSNSPACMSAC